MLKFLMGDRVRQIPDLSSPILGIPRDAVCVVGRSKVSFGKGAEGQIDLQTPNGSVVTSLPAARFEKIQAAGAAVSVEV